VGSIVYHYTDTQAFKGVVEKAALWGTDFRYLNDSLELVYTWTAFVDRLTQLSKEPGEYSEAYRAQLEALNLMNATDLMAFDDAMFVACFTELPDAVSQWTRYGANGRGLALGFDSERIRALNVPQYHHAPGGQLIPMTAIVAGAATSDQVKVEFKWGAFLQQVAYGDAARDRVVDGLIDTVEGCCDRNWPDPDRLIQVRVRPRRCRIGIGFQMDPFVVTARTASSTICGHQWGSRPLPTTVTSTT
jgi:hypothetical protein